MKNSGIVAILVNWNGSIVEISASSCSGHSKCSNEVGICGLWDKFKGVIGLIELGVLWLNPDKVGNAVVNELEDGVLGVLEVFNRELFLVIEWVSKGNCSDKLGNRLVPEFILGKLFKIGEKLLFNILGLRLLAIVLRDFSCVALNKQGLLFIDFIFLKNQDWNAKANY